jgi:hypothetical protein
VSALVTDVERKCVVVVTELFSGLRTPERKTRRIKRL